MVPPLCSPSRDCLSLELFLLLSLFRKVLPMLPLFSLDFFSSMEPLPGLLEAMSLVSRLAMVN